MLQHVTACSSVVMSYRITMLSSKFCMQSNKLTTTEPKDVRGNGSRLSVT